MGICRRPVADLWTVGALYWHCNFICIFVKSNRASESSQNRGKPKFLRPLLIGIGGKSSSKFIRLEELKRRTAIHGGVVLPITPRNRGYLSLGEYTTHQSGLSTTYEHQSHKQRVFLDARSATEKDDKTKVLILCNAHQSSDCLKS